MVDNLINNVIYNIADMLGELDDTDEAPFGEFARINIFGNRIVIAHESDDSIQIEIMVRRK